MNPKQPAGGRELNEISAPAGQHFTPSAFACSNLKSRKSSAANYWKRDSQTIIG